MTFASTPFYRQHSALCQTRTTVIFIITMTTIIAIMMTMITMTTIILMVVITRQFCFISNTDNLGATVDLGILELCLSGNQEFIMEVIQHLNFKMMMTAMLMVMMRTLMVWS